MSQRQELIQHKQPTWQIQFGSAGILVGFVGEQRRRLATKGLHLNVRRMLLVDQEGRRTVGQPTKPSEDEELDLIRSKPNPM
jgi:hypothetical protein